MHVAWQWPCKKQCHFAFFLPAFLLPQGCPGDYWWGPWLTVTLIFGQLFMFFTMNSWTFIYLIPTIVCKLDCHYSYLNHEEIKKHWALLNKGHRGTQWQKQHQNTKFLASTSSILSSHLNWTVQMRKKKILSMYTYYVGETIWDRFQITTYLIQKTKFFSSGDHYYFSLDDRKQNLSTKCHFLK